MLKHADVTEKVIEAFYRVFNTLGSGFLEKVYENAMVVELTRMRVEAFQQAPIEVYYAGEKVGQYFADLLVQGCVVVEIKAAEALCESHQAQLVNYLKATNFEVGLLLNFGPKPEMKRKVYDNTRKPLLISYSDPC